MAAGTQADPYIVTSWAQCLQIISDSDNSNCYVKWSDMEHESDKVVDINLTTGVQTYEKQIDWNGWTINTLEISCPYSDAITPRQSGSDMGHGMKAVLYRGAAPGLYLSIWRNFTINYMKVTDVHLCVWWGYTLLNAYIDCTVETNLTTSSSYWAWGGTGYEKGDNLCPFGLSFVVKSVINFHSKNIAPRVPFIDTWADTDLYIDYKWDLDESTDKRGIVPRAWFGRHNYAENVYVGGTVNLRHDNDSTVYMPFMREVMQGDWDSMHSKSYDGYFGKNVTFNIRFLTDENSKVTLTQQTFGSTWPESAPADGLHIVPNNGDEYKNLTKVTAYYQNTNPILLGDLKNPNYLDSIGYRYELNDNTRFPKYGNDVYGDRIPESDPDWTRQLSPKLNGGIPFLPFYSYPEAAPIANYGAVVQTPYITVYDMKTPQNGFTGHGLAVLNPTSCRVVEELNGAFNVTMTHPKDEEGVWQYILEMNIIQVLGQLFVIQKVDEVQRGNSFYITCYAEHISYTLNDRWIFPPVTIAGWEGQVLLDSIIAQSTDMGGSWQTNYVFNLTTDLNADQTFRDWYEMPDGVTPYEMILGSNGFISRIGGELYRDNFDMSIHTRMENAEDNAFEMAIGYNLTGVTRTVDLSTFCTYLRGYDVSDDETAYQQWFAVSWDPSTLPRAYPRNVVRSMNFSYDHPEYAMGQLERDTMTFFNQNCAPLVSYELNVQDLKRNPDYKMFSNNYRYKVGDKGRVYDERLKAWVELEITQTEKDGITGDCLKVVIGTTRSFTRPSGYTPLVPRPEVIIDADKILEGVPPLMFYSGGNPLINWTVFGAQGGVGNAVAGNNLYHGALQEQFYNPSNGQPVPGVAAVSNVELLPVEPNTQYTFSIHYSVQQTGGAFIIQHDANGNFVRNDAAQNQVTVTTQSNTRFVRLQIGASSGTYTLDTVDDFMFNLGSSPLPYEPYSATYEIPITITSGLESTTYTIPINAPLDEGDSISSEEYTLTINTYRGDNTLTVGTTVQPRVEITYKEV